MAKKNKQGKLGKLTRGLCIAASVLVILPCLGVVTFGILDLAGVFPFLSHQVNNYTISYFDAEDNLMFTSTKPRGEKFETFDGTPSKIGYKFMGWDIDNNNLIDAIPVFAYQNVYAKPVWYLVDPDVLSSEESSEETTEPESSNQGVLN